MCVLCGGGVCACVSKIIIYLEHPLGDNRQNMCGGIRSLQQTGQVIISAQQHEPDLIVPPSFCLILPRFSRFLIEASHVSHLSSLKLE